MTSKGKKKMTKTINGRNTRRRALQKGLNDFYRAAGCLDKVGKVDGIVNKYLMNLEALYNKLDKKYPGAKEHGALQFLVDISKMSTQTAQRSQTSHSTKKASLFQSSRSSSWQKPRSETTPRVVIEEVAEQSNWSSNWNTPALNRNKSFQNKTSKQKQNPLKWTNKQQQPSWQAPRQQQSTWNSQQNSVQVPVNKSPWTFQNKFTNQAKQKKQVKRQKTDIQIQKRQIKNRLLKIINHKSQTLNRKTKSIIKIEKQK